MVRREFLPHGQNVNGHFYVHVLQKLRDVAREEKGWQLAGRVFAASR